VSPEASNVTNGSANARNNAALTVGVSDRPPFGVKDDIRRERKPPDRNILDRDRVVDGLRQWGIVIVFAAIIVIFSGLRPTTFMTFQNVVNVVNNSSSLLLFAMAATVALAIGEFDLSFVAVADLVAVLVGVLVTGFGWTSAFGIAGALALGLVGGAAIGAINGLFVAKAFVPSFVATLAVGSIAAGLELATQVWIAGGMKQISVIVLPAPLQALGSATAFGTPIKWTVVLVFLFASALWLLMRRTTPGRQAYAIGGNPMAAYLAGAPVAALRIAAFALIGFIAALAGSIALAERGYFNMGSPPLLLPAYTAAFLGAAVLAKKKRFDIFGSVFSVFVLLALSNGLSLLNQPRWIASAISGLVLLAAVLLNRPQNRKV
jgi:ribose transport system permease protein